MPILDLQQRARELGRIRIGQVVSGSNGKLRPEKLDRFRLTSASKALLDQVAALYGGTVQEWTPQNGGVPAWEVITTSMRLPVLVPPQPVSQWYETWSGGGCQRRCDGLREVLTDSPCICGPDPQERLCKPTTRLNVVLAEVEGVGVWRLETHGYYAAVELPSAAELLAAANGYIRGHLALEERIVKREGKTKRFMVPTLEVGVTPAELMAGGGRVDTPAIEAPKQAALPAAAPAPVPAPKSGKEQLTDQEYDVLVAQIGDCAEIGKLRVMWGDVASAFEMPSLLEQRFRARAAELATLEHETPIPVPAGGTADELWAEILRAVPADWTLPQVEKDFANVTETDPEVAGPADMRTYLQHLAAS